MNRLQQLLMGGMGAIAVMWASPGTAQSSGQPPILLEPDLILVEGQRCAIARFSCHTETRRLLLRANTDLSDLQVVSRDLPQINGTKVLPASAIAANFEKTSLQSGTYLTLPITIDFREATSGEFTGTLLLMHDGGELALPLTVRVKDRWLLPLLTLLLGVGMGVGASLYRNEGMAREELVVRIGRLRTSLRGDDELASLFSCKIEAHLTDAEAALGGREWERAEQAIARAWQLWDKWRRGREDWLALLRHQESIVPRLEEADIDLDSSYMRQIRSRLEDLARETPDKDDPTQLNRGLDALHAQVDRYLQGHAAVGQLNQLIAKLPLESELSWKMNAQKLQHWLNSLTPGDAEAYDGWLQQTYGAINDVVGAIAQQTSYEAGTPQAAIAARLAYVITPQSLVPVPTAHPLPALDPVQTAQNRLFWFQWLSYSVALMLLAGTGFLQLYVEHPTFGSKGWSHYITLLAWGFGAEATREAIARVIREGKPPMPFDRDEE